MNKYIETNSNPVPWLKKKQFNLFSMRLYFYMNITGSIATELIDITNISLYNNFIYFPNEF